MVISRSPHSLLPFEESLRHRLSIPFPDDRDAFSSTALLVASSSPRKSPLP